MMKRICTAFILFLSGMGIGFGETGEAEIRRQLVYRAYAYMGTPYVYGGISGKGVDCSGLVYRVYQDVLQKKLPRIVSRLYESGREIDNSSVKPGDLVFFDTTGGVSHVGIYVGDQSFIHAASEGRVIGVKESKLNQEYYKKRYVGARTYLRSPDDRPLKPAKGEAALSVDKPFSPFTGTFITSRGKMVITRLDGYGNVSGTIALEGRYGRLWGKIDAERGILTAKWVLPGEYGKAGASGEARFSLSRNPGMLDGMWRKNGDSRWYEDWDAWKQ